MIIGPLDLGSHNPYKMPKPGMHTAAVEIPGGYAVPYAVDSTHPAWHAKVWVQAPNAVGQYASKTQAAVEFLGRQLEEYVRNYDQQPTYIQFYAGTGTVAHSPAFSEPQDGWYYINSVVVDYTKSQFTFVIVDLDIEYASPGAPRMMGMSTSGGALSTGFSGTPTNWVAFPLNNQATIGGYTGLVGRTGAEGGISVLIGPLVNPTPFVPSSTATDSFKDGCHVYDAMAAIGTNPVPTSGAFLHTNWIEVFGKDHRFVGDMVITNGLHLYTFSAGVLPGVVGYLWNTNLAPAQWEMFRDLRYIDNAFSGSGTLRSFSLSRVGWPEVTTLLIASTLGAKAAQLRFRLQAGAYASRLEFVPLSESNSSVFSLDLGTGPTTKIFYNSAGVQDTVLAEADLAPTADYGYAAGLSLISNNSYLVGWLYAAPPGGNQPKNGNSGTNMYLGDSTQPAQNATAAYGIFAVPFAAPQNLQGEGEAGSKGGSWVSVADAAASGGNAAKLPATSNVSHNDTINGSHTFPAGTYQAWFRVKVTSTASAQVDMTLGVWNATASANAVAVSYKPNQMSTSYIWVSPGTFASDGTSTYYLFSTSVPASLATDWFVDQAVMVPLTSTTSWSFPQDLFQQFLFDRTSKLRIS